MNFFESVEPYKIADKVTGCHELAPDLVAHVFLLMRERKDIDNQTAFFARVCYQQWNWHNSEFNKLYRPNQEVRLNEEICVDVDDLDVIHNDQFKQFLRDYFKRTAPSIGSWYCREIAYLWLYEDMTYREISKETGINIRYITEAIKQFKDDIFNSFHSSSSQSDTNNV